MTSISRQCAFCGWFDTNRKVLKVGPSLPISDGYPTEEEIAASESDVYATICWRYVEFFVGRIRKEASDFCK
jgi:hypothetical protein